MTLKHNQPAHNQFVTPEELAKLRLPLEEARNLPRAAYVSDHIIR